MNVFVKNVVRALFHMVIRTGNIAVTSVISRIGSEVGANAGG